MDYSQIAIGASLVFVTVRRIAKPMKSQTATVRFIVILAGIGWILTNAKHFYDEIQSKKINVIGMLIVAAFVYGYDKMLQCVIASKNGK